MILKIKVLIYRYLGIYLADKEENDYIHSKEFWQAFQRMRKKNKDIDDRNVFGILCGLWQADHGFSRPFSSFCFKHRFLRWFWVFFKTLKDDLRQIFKISH